MRDLVTETHNGERVYLSCVAAFQPRVRVYHIKPPTFWQRMMALLWGERA